LIKENAKDLAQGKVMVNVLAIKDTVENRVTNVLRISMRLSEMIQSCFVQNVTSLVVVAVEALALWVTEMNGFVIMQIL